jgi:hypothetical protein
MEAKQKQRPATTRARDSALSRTLTPGTKLRRWELAEALTDEGFPTATSTLATMGSRGTGPDFDLWGRIPIYTWGTSLEWAKKRLKRVRSNSSGELP